MTIGAVSAARFDPTTITRPHPRLMTYYVWLSIFSLLAFPVTLLALWIRYRTMEFRSTTKGSGSARDCSGGARSTWPTDASRTST